MINEEELFTYRANDEIASELYAAASLDAAVLRAKCAKLLSALKEICPDDIPEETLDQSKGLDWHVCDLMIIARDAIKEFEK